MIAGVPHVKCSKIFFVQYSGYVRFVSCSTDILTVHRRRMNRDWRSPWCITRSSFLASTVCLRAQIFTEVIIGIWSKENKVRCSPLLMRYLIDESTASWMLWDVWYWGFLTLRGDSRWYRHPGQITLFSIIAWSLCSKGFLISDASI